MPSCAEFVAGALEAFTARDMIASYIAKVALLLEDLSEPTYPSSVK